MYRCLLGKYKINALRPALNVSLSKQFAFDLSGKKDQTDLFMQMATIRLKGEIDCFLSSHL